MSILATASRRFWARLLSAGQLVLLLSLLPSVLYIDHWAEFIFPNEAHQMSEAEHALHESHCHFGGGSCGEQPVPTNLRMLVAVVDLPDPRLVATVLEDVRRPFQETFVTPPTDPPRLS
jgi:hypothetical protein